MTRNVPDAAPGGAADPAPAAEPVIADPAPADPAVPVDAAPTAPDFGWAGEDFNGEDGFKMDDFRGHYQDLLTEKTLRDEQMADVPEDGNYAFALAEDFDYGDFKPPEGMGVEIDVESETFKPLFGELSGFLKDNNIPQGKATELVGFLAKHEAAKMKVQHDAAVASYNQIGANDAAREARITRLGRALETKLPADQAAALKSMTGDVHALRAIEALAMGKVGGPTPTPVPATTERDPLANRYKNSAAS